MHNDRCIFRGKRKDDGEWVQGYFYKIWDECYILWGMTNGIPNMIKVDSDTIGQCTGLKDKRGTLIFEGDIVKTDHEITSNARVYHDGLQLGDFGGEASRKGFRDYEVLEVIGNIWDNPELLPKNL